MWSHVLAADARWSASSFRGRPTCDGIHGTPVDDTHEMQPGSQRKCFFRQLPIGFCSTSGVSTAESGPMTETQSPHEKAAEVEEQIERHIVLLSWRPHCLEIFSSAALSFFFIFFRGNLSCVYTTTIEKDIKSESGI